MVSGESYYDNTVFPFQRRAPVSTTVGILQRIVYSLPFKSASYFIDKADSEPDPLSSSKESQTFWDDHDVYYIVMPPSHRGHDIKEYTEP